MDRPDLAPLYKLHLVDAAIVDIRKRAAALDPGREIMAKIAAITKDFEAKHGEAQRLNSEVADTELAQKSIEDKIKKFDKELYGGSVVNPKEVETIQREIVLLKEQRSKLDEKLLALWDKLPPAAEAEKASADLLDRAKHALQEHQKKVIELKNELEAEFKKQNAKLGELVKGVDPALLKQYTAIKERAGGIGMAEITPKGTCGRCGTVLPERTIVAVKEDKLTTCESCHRILFSVVPSV